MLLNQQLTNLISVTENCLNLVRLQMMSMQRVWEKQLEQIWKTITVWSSRLKRNLLSWVSNYLLSLTVLKLIGEGGSEQKEKPEMVEENSDEFLRNFFIKFGMRRTLEAF